MEFRYGDSTLVLTIYVKNGDPWFKAKEIALFLGYGDPGQAIRKRIHADNKISWIDLHADGGDFETPSNWQPNTVFIDKFGFHQLLLRSKLPSAEVLQAWLTMEVMPQLKQQDQVERLKRFAELVTLNVDDLTCKNGYIYVATTDAFENENFYKIGSSTNVEKRLAELNKSSPTDWRSIASFESSKHLIDLTKMCDELKDLHAGRDFFRFSSPSEALDKCKETYAKIKSNL